MSLTDTLDTLINQFSDTNLQAFLRMACGAFKPLQADMSHFLQEGGYFEDLVQVGIIEFNEAQRLQVAICHVKKELDTRTGKRGQYELIKKTLKQSGSFDGGLFAFYDQAGHFRLSLVLGQASGPKRVFTSFRRYTYFVSKGLPNKTFKHQLSQAEAFSSLERILKTFSIEAVSDDFYKAFEPRFSELAQNVGGEADGEMKKDFALLFVIRVLFLGFVQKKGWLGNSKEFLQEFWAEYRRSDSQPDSFYRDWLKPLFFEALNSPPGQKVAYGVNSFSEQTQLALQMAPYLNGELFKPRPGMDDIGLMLPDRQIGDFFDFLFQYNFTVEENTLYDEELELNPEFLGIIFERLVNKEDGAVYTPRPEVDLMCRLALVKWLEKQKAASTEDLYNLFFRNIGSQHEYDDDQRQGDFTSAEIEKIVGLLETVTICDPAAGSGAFEVGMLQVLEEVLDNLFGRNNAPAKLQNRTPDRFERKKAIIASSLYGVEVKRWAVWINQLRLWLTLFVDMPDDFKKLNTPLLPNLSFKVRVGDSLVQRVGSRTFPVHGHADLPQAIKIKVTHLKAQKKNFFYNLTDNYAAIENAEVQLFAEILDEQIGNLQTQLNNLLVLREQQEDMFDPELTKQREKDLQAQKATERANLQTQIADLKAQKRDLKQERPFLWSLEFAEVFFDREGFDIIIGNPPYVRQEQISDPNQKLDAKEYKAALQEMLRLDFPQYFAKSLSNLEEFKTGRKPAGRSDLYTYFYVRSLRLLNPAGIHVFICSNSWLDVGYGVWLQEFLLHNTPVHFVIDNHARRSFANADVNTVITVIDAPTVDANEEHNVRFVAFKQPFDNAVTAEKMSMIDSVQRVLNTDVLRVYPVQISTLIKEGSETENLEGFSEAVYVGQKWGGVYLRAPDIYFKILETIGSNLQKLGELAEIRRGITTGADEWFYLTSSKVKELGIEKKYLKPILTDPGDRNVPRITVTTESADMNLLVIREEKEGLSNALHGWIVTGETVAFKGRGKSSSIPATRSSVKSRKRWFELPPRSPAPLLWIEVKKRRSFTAFNRDRLLVDRSFYEIFPTGNFDPMLLCAILNCSLTALFCEIQGNAPGGSGAGVQMTVAEVRRLRIPNPDLFSQRERESLLSIFKDLSGRQMGPIYDDFMFDDRRALDQIVFGALGLPLSLIDELHKAIRDIVMARLAKASKAK